MDRPEAQELKRVNYHIAEAIKESDHLRRTLQRLRARKRALERRIRTLDQYDNERAKSGT
ncbi:unnamed protein product [marine sediment metagenome]|uniref:Uncharacterized protein n=1 Tax=marine sediment metagenome TaxID=412755 RepID=X1NYH4_9ZZZZ